MLFVELFHKYHPSVKHKDQAEQSNWLNSASSGFEFCISTQKANSFFSYELFHPNTLSLPITSISSSSSLFHHLQQQLPATAN